MILGGFVDTSVIVRYLTGDPKPLAVRAARILDSDADLGVTDVVLAETAHVLTSVYGLSRTVVVDALIALVQKENVSVPGMDTAVVVQALLLCRPSRRVSFADALVWAAARSSRRACVYTFDDRFPSSGVELRGD